MSRLTCLVVALALTAVVVGAPPAARAATIRIGDPDRDGQQGAALDITSVRLSNNDHAVVTEIAFRRVTAGDLALYYRPVGSGGEDVVQVVSRHRGRGDRNYVATLDGRQPCGGLRVTWDDARDTARVRLPATCLRGGDYGALRTRIITEIGADADLAPSTPRGAWPWSRAVGRGEPGVDVAAGA